MLLSGKCASMSHDGARVSHMLDMIPQSAPKWMVYLQKKVPGCPKEKGPTPMGRALSSSRGEGAQMSKRAERLAAG